MKCAVCGADFELTRPDRLYCSERCAKRAYKIKERDKARKWLQAQERTCPVCGKKFTPNRRDQKYCSKKCQSRRLCTNIIQEFREQNSFDEFFEQIYECSRRNDTQRTEQLGKRGMEIMATYSEINEKKGRYAERVVEKYLKGKYTIQSQPHPYPTGGARVDYLCAAGDDAFYVEVKYRRLFGGKYFSLCEWLVDAYRSFALQKGLPVWLYLVDVETGAIYAQELSKLLTPAQIGEEEFPKKTTQQLPDGDKPFLVWHISQFNLAAEIGEEDLQWHALNIENNMEESTAQSEMTIKELITSLQNPQSETDVEESTNSQPEVQSEVKVEEPITPQKSQAEEMLKDFGISAQELATLLLEKRRREFERSQAELMKKYEVES